MVKRGKQMHHLWQRDKGCYFCALKKEIVVATTWGWGITKYLQLDWMDDRMDGWMEKSSQPQRPLPYVMFGLLHCQKSHFSLMFQSKVTCVFHASNLCSKWPSLLINVNILIKLDLFKVMFSCSENLPQRLLSNETKHQINFFAHKIWTNKAI
jgi:hypothetical protein